MSEVKTLQPQDIGKLNLLTMGRTVEQLVEKLGILSNYRDIGTKLFNDPALYSASRDVLWERQVKITFDEYYKKHHRIACEDACNKLDNLFDMMVNAGLVTQDTIDKYRLATNRVLRAVYGDWTIYLETNNPADEVINLANSFVKQLETAKQEQDPKDKERQAKIIEFLSRLTTEMKETNIAKSVLNKLTSTTYNSEELDSIQNILNELLLNLSVNEPMVDAITVNPDLIKAYDRKLDWAVALFNISKRTHQFDLNRDYAKYMAELNTLALDYLASNVRLRPKQMVLRDLKNTNNKIGEITRGIVEKIHGLYSGKVRSVQLPATHPELAELLAKKEKIEKELQDVRAEEKRKRHGVLKTIPNPMKAGTIVELWTGTGAIPSGTPWAGVANELRQSARNTLRSYYQSVVSEQAVKLRDEIEGLSSRRTVESITDDVLKLSGSPLVKHVRKDVSVDKLFYNELKAILEVDPNSMIRNLDGKILVHVDKWQRAPGSWKTLQERSDDVKRQTGKGLI